MATMQEIFDSLSAGEKASVLPIDFEDINANDYDKVNEYNQYLAKGQFAEAATFRQNNSVLEKYIFDAKKMNYLQALALGSYEYAKKGGSIKEVTIAEYWELYNNEKVEPDTTYFIKDEDYSGLGGLGGYIFKEVTTLPTDAASKKNTIFIVG